MTTQITGGCACGAVRYECSAEPMMAGHCQCQSCQKATGGGHASAFMVPSEAVTVTGKVKEYNRLGDSGQMVSRVFCPVCGSPIYGKSAAIPDGITIMAASLDDPTRFKPAMVIYSKSAQAWDHIDPELPKFPEMPPM